MDNTKESSQYYQTVPKSPEETNGYYHKSAPNRADLTIMYDKWAITYEKVK